MKIRGKAINRGYFYSAFLSSLLLGGAPNYNIDTVSVYCIYALVRRCLEGLTPPYLREFCCPTVAIQRRISLHSSAQAELLVPCTLTVMRQCRTFFVVGPMTWNCLLILLRLTPVGHSAIFLSCLKTALFDRGWAGRTPE